MLYQKAGKFGQVAPIKYEFCRDFVGSNVGDWWWRPLRSRRLSRHFERWRARDRRRPVFQLRGSDGRRRRGQPNNHARCGMWLVAFLGACVLSLSRGYIGSQGRRSRPSLHVYHLPRGYEGCACVSPNYSSSSTGPQDQQQ